MKFIYFLLFWLFEFFSQFILRHLSSIEWNETIPTRVSNTFDKYRWTFQFRVLAFSFKSTAYVGWCSFFSVDCVSSVFAHQNNPSSFRHESHRLSIKCVFFLFASLPDQLNLALIELPLQESAFQFIRWVLLNYIRYLSAKTHSPLHHVTPIQMNTKRYIAISQRCVTHTVSIFCFYYWLLAIFACAC